jgi:hypothetical protein
MAYGNAEKAWTYKEYVERYEQLTTKNAQLRAELDKHRWMLTDNPPDNIEWEKKVLALEYESEIPIIATMAEIFLDEYSEIEYWQPIILPNKE